uniref:Uncharacterized protein n=1 Tax=Anguilla anguilla TaxID=7936 RepID=A0A0E9V6I1_ANGAN
MNFTEVCSV